MTPLWTPSPARVAQTRLTHFTRRLEARARRQLPTYADLHGFSVDYPGAFWSAVWDECGVVGDRGRIDVRDPDRMPGAAFFPDGSLNFAANLLRRTDEAPAIHAYTEAGGERVISFAALRRDAIRAALALRAEGVQPGDRVAGIVSNVPEAIVAALGTAAIGAIWSSCSPDFGVQGVLDRFGQIEPVVLVAMDGYHYGGKTFDCGGKVRDVASRLPSVRRVVTVPLAGTDVEVPGAVAWEAWLAGPGDAGVTGFVFEPRPFAHPLYILFSSGTTGVPKCIVHGAGGTLLQHLKEHQLHCDVRRDDRVFYFTTCGWMMWNWLVTALASEASLVLYDGSPFHPDGRRLFDLIDAAGITLFGVSAKYIDAVGKAGLSPIRTHRLGSLRTITSTGSPLAPESFDLVYERIRHDVHLASISGGTDIVSCFVGGNPNLPVWRGEIQCAGLGMDVDVFGPDARPVKGTAGELVCKSPFPSMPVRFWNDPDGSRYHAAYFERFRDVWCHGDWIKATDHGGYVIYGRSDATLNPGGVRIGTAEIYRQVEQLPEVLESLAVGQRWQGDERIVLFVRLADGVTMDDALRRRITTQIRTNTTPRHVPAKIVAVADIPRTKSGKITELAVRSVIHGEPVGNREALANPEALDLFRDVPDLTT
ncbi:MAG: acetoacetate--CoA ligase [Vicinamibacterales bacterium]